jgi:hypothetical protein
LAKQIDLKEQARELEARFGFEHQIWGKTLLSRGTIKPTAISNSYLIQLSYRIGRRPRVFVVDPPIERRNGVRADHMYGENELCVFLPGTGEWAEHKLLARTLVPWSMLWLLFYETWLITGRWDGGGTSH